MTRSEFRKLRWVDYPKLHAWVWETMQLDSNATVTRTVQHLAKFASLMNPANHFAFKTDYAEAHEALVAARTEIEKAEAWFDGLLNRSD